MEASKISSKLRAIGVAAGLGLTYLLLAVSVSGVFRASNPELALRWRSGDARANAALAEELLAGDPNASPEQISSYAIRALRRDATITDAVRVLALLAAQSDRDQARRLMRYALALSRRDLPTHLWYIEDYVAQSSVAGALFHYDAALRTSRQAGSMLLPVLVSAISEPPVTAELNKLLDRAPPWRNDFLEAVARQGEHFDASVQLAVKYLNPTVAREAELIQILLNRLIAAGRYGLAERLYDSKVSTRSPAGSRARNGEFNETPEFTPFDWSLVNEQGFSAQVAVPSGASEPALVLNSTSGRGGALASQLLSLEPGRYRFSAVSGNTSRNGQVYFTLRCIETNYPLFRANAPRAGAEGEPLRASFSVPAAACPAQWLDIGVAAGLSGLDAEPWVDKVTIDRPRDSMD